MVLGVGHVDAALRVDRHAARLLHLAGIFARRAAELEQKIARRRQFFYAVVVQVRYIQVARGIERDGPRRIELARAAAMRPPTRQRLATGRKLLNAVVDGFGDVDVAAAVDGDAVWTEELRRTVAR